MAVAQAPELEITSIHSQPSWVVRSGQVELAVTQLGAHMAPVTFDRASARPIQPYYISPWQDEGTAMPAPVLAPLRGDFFCLPFGGNGTLYHGESHPPHGETSGSAWTMRDLQQSGAVTTLSLTLEPRVRPGRVTRQFSIAEGQNALYLTTTIEGFAGPAPLGHHAILAMPGRERAVLLSTSPHRLAMVCPHTFSPPESGEYQALQPGAIFDDLAQVPTIFKEPAVTDCASYPARRGYADLVGLFDDPARREPSWIAAVNTAEDWLWFSLKDPAVLPGRMLWMEHHGRHGAPWSGRNCCLGLEEICAYFDKGVAESSAENLLSRQGIPTCHTLAADRPFAVRNIQGAARLPAGFGAVRTVEFGANTATFSSTTGQQVTIPLRASFLFDGQIAK